MKIAYLEDSADFAILVRTWLQRAGYEVVWFEDGEKCARAITEAAFDLCLLDWMVPSMTGPEVMEHVKIKLRDATPPVIFTTSRDSEEDVVAILNAGADDYIVKPFSSQLLLARLQAVLRRKVADMPLEEHQDFSDLKVDFARRQFSWQGEAIALSDRELELALYFFQNLEHILTRESLTKVVWRIAPGIDTRTVDAHVSVLRKKLRLSKEYGLLLTSVYGRGYRLERVKD